MPIVRVPKEGHKLNPLLDLPRNGPCMCGSAEKFKKCCLHKLAECVTDAQYKELKPQVDHFKKAFEHHRKISR